MVVGSLFATGCSNEPKSANEKNMTLQITSIAFSEGQTIPQKYSCAGSDISPPLAWTQPPPGTKSIALVCEDPDAPGGTFTHWVMYNMPSTEVVLSENMARTEILDDGRRQGKNSFGKIGYSGPCPPPGKPHRYFFEVYALDTPLNLPPGTMKKNLVEAMNNHVLAKGQLTGTFGR